MDQVVAENKSICMRLRVDPKVHAKLRKLAEKEDRSLSNYIALALAELVKKPKGVVKK